MKPRFFKTQSEFRAWLEKNHATKKELYVGFYKKASGKATITWPEAVDVALCFGWIDGVRKSIDETAYMNRFTPRRPRSNWSAVNIARVKELKKLGLMTPAGVAAFERRSQDRSGVYSYEQRKEARLTPELEKLLRADKKAWAFFESRPPSYKQTVTWWVVSAKKEETRRRRLETLIRDSAEGRLVSAFARPPRER